MVSILSFKDIAKIFEEIELRLISSLKRNLKRHKAEEQRYGFEWSAWQAEKLKNMENFRRENLDIMNEYVDVIDDQTRQLMTEQFQEGQQQAQRSAQELSDEPITPIPDKHFFGVNEKKMAKLMEDVTTLEKTAETAALRMTDDIYRQTLNRVQLAMGTGSMTLNEAIDLAIKDFLDKGINCIVYADGKRVNIADYVRMALRTTSTRAALQGAAKRFAELGYDTVLVSQYGGCSKTCEPWQGQVYIDDVFTVWEGEKDEFQGKSNYCGEWFWLLSYAVKNGLFHPNCRHTMTQYIHGRTQIPEPIPAEKIKEQRELEQKQRAMERKIRKLKRFAAGTCDPDTAKEYRRKLRQAQHELKVFVDEHNEVLHRDYGREKVYSGNDVPFSAKPGKDDNAIANLSYIDSQEYADKFKGKYANEQVEKSVVSACRQVVKNRNGTFYEEAYFIDANTGKTFSYVKGKHKNGIVMPEKLKKRLTAAPKNSIIMIHNHPNSSPLSTDDYKSSAKYGSLFEVVASGHNGDVYVFRDTFGTKGAMYKYSDGIEECQTVRDFRIAFTKEKIRNGLDEFEARNKAWKDISMLRGFFYEKR